MTDKIKNIILTAVLAAIIFGFGIYMLFGPGTDYSDAERRVLAKFPETTTETVLNGNFMKDFETFTLDQFPLRDTFRSIKMFTALNVFGNLTANDLYVYKDYVVKQEYPLNEEVVSGNLDKVLNVYNKYVKDKTENVYFVIVPDKNYYFAPLSNRLVFDWEVIKDKVSEKLPMAEIIDITGEIDYSAYYFTDTHWSQDKIIPVADKIAVGMNATLPSSYTEHTMEKDFYGVYTGQLMLPVKADKIVYLRNDVIDSFVVKSVNDMGKWQKDYVYNFSKEDSKDMYDFFMSGAIPIISIDNPSSDNDRHLIVFRDSFGSSLSPLLAQGYAKTTVVDIRYINPAFLGSYVDFTDADVLFMYSPLVLNSPAVLQG